MASFVFNSGLDNGNGFANYLTDLTWGGSNLWASAYNGFVYQLSSTGSIISSFDTGVIDTGVTTDGTNLYTTSGLGLLAPSSLIYKRDLQGAVLATIDTGLNDTLGIGFDSSSGTFFVGGLDVVSQVAADGSVLGAFANDGTHTGLEVGDIGTGPGPGDGEVPEPGTVALIGGGLLVIGWRKIRSLRALPIVTLGAVVFAAHVVAAVSITSFTPSTNPPAPVGTAITFTTTASDSSAGVLRYRYRVRYNSGAYSTIVSYGPSKTFKWTPADKEGLYDVEVSVINRTTLSTASTSKPFLVTSRVTGGPTVTSTVHPLVALYSAPSCPAGAMRVRFKTASQAYWQSTSTKPCNGSTSMNFYVGGMYPSTTYTMRNDVINGPQITTSGDVTFTTSAASPSLPATTATIPLQPPTSMTEASASFLRSWAPIFFTRSMRTPSCYGIYPAPITTAQSPHREVHFS